MQAPVAAGPQAPLAAGPLGSVLEVVSVADPCGVRQLRLDTRREDGLAPARLYLDGPTAATAELCVEAWLTRNGNVCD
jgi:hypothetical protein